MIHSVAISEMVGTHYFSPLKGDFKTCIDQAAQIGYEGVEIHVRNPFAVDFNELRRESEERRVGKECRSRWSPYH